MKANGKPETLDVLLAWSRRENPYERWPEWTKAIQRITRNLKARGLITPWGTGSNYVLTVAGAKHLVKLKDDEIVWYEFPPRQVWGDAGWRVG